jgi:hypothetical protein
MDDDDVRADVRARSRLGQFLCAAGYSHAHALIRVSRATDTDTAIDRWPTAR